MFDSLGGGESSPERNTAWNKGRKCFHCLGAPNNLIRPCLSGLKLGRGHTRKNKTLMFLYQTRQVRQNVRVYPSLSFSLNLLFPDFVLSFIRFGNLDGNWNLKFSLRARIFDCFLFRNYSTKLNITETLLSWLRNLFSIFLFSRNIWNVGLTSQALILQ